MDHDGVDAEVLYPTPRLAQGVVATKDVDFHLALVRAYNDWLSEYVAVAPERFAGLMLLPNRGADTAVAEIDRVLGRPGIRGVMLGCYPNGTLEIDRRGRRGLGAHRRGRRPAQHPREPVAAHAGRAPRRAPRLRPLLRRAEPHRAADLRRASSTASPTSTSSSPRSTAAGCRTSRSRSTTTTGASTRSATSTSPRLPSEYVERHLHFTYLTDPFGIANRASIGVERILWSSDYPHISSDWPHSWDAIEETFAGVAADERDAILHGNAQRLYGFGR